VYGGVFWSENRHVCHQDTLNILDTHSQPYLVGWCVSKTHTVFKTRCHTIQTHTHRHTFSTQQANTAITLLTDKDTLPISSEQDSLLFYVPSVHLDFCFNGCFLCTWLVIYSTGASRGADTLPISSEQDSLLFYYYNNPCLWKMT